MGTLNLLPEITPIFAPDHNRLDFIWSLRLSDRFEVIKLPQTVGLAPKLNYPNCRFSPKIKLRQTVGLAPKFTNLKIFKWVVSPHFVSFSQKLHFLV